jgi:Undecaprenyl-phosphate glucose phosphotransferase
MHGMIPPDPGPPQAPPGATLVETGWARFAPRGRSADLAEAWTLARPFPPLLLAAGAALLDAAGIALSGALLNWSELSAGRPAPELILFLAALLPCLMGLAGAYAHPALFGGRRALSSVLAVAAGGIAALWLAGQALGAPGALPAGVAALWLAGAAPLLLAGRLAQATALRRAAERTRRRVVLVGDGPHAQRLVQALRTRQDHGLRLLGVVDDRPGATSPSGRGRSGLPHLGDLGSLLAMIRRDEVDEVILALPWAAEARLMRVRGVLADYPVDVRLAPELVAYHGCRPGAPEAGGLLLPRLVERPMNGLAGAIKAAEDYLLALIALAIAAVPMALIALAIRLDSPGPVLFRQRRTGFNNRDFHVFKFRTMYHDAADPEARCQVTEGDPRVTRVGALLRRTSLDELPQIFNILRGEMSFVGPRPHAPGTLAAGRPFEQVFARYAARHRVKPGLTGLAQVRGWRGPTDTEEKLIRRVESDLEYIERWSLWLDFVIILRTLLAVARMRNAL